MMIYKQATEFSSDLQTLAQRIPTLPADIERVKPRLVRIFAEPSETMVADFRQQLFACGKAAIIQQTAQCTVVQLCLDTDTAAYRRAVWLVFAVVRALPRDAPSRAVRAASTIILIEVYATPSKAHGDKRRIKRIMNKLEEA
jgi:hypothetical protein